MPQSIPRFWWSGLLFAVAGTLLFSLKPILIKQVYLYPVHSDQLITLRMLFAAPFYLFVAASQCWRNPQRRRLARQSLGQVMLLGIMGYYVASYLDLMALQYITAQLERLVLFSFPTLVVLMSWWFLRTPLPANIGWILGLSYSGIVLIFGHDMLTMGDEVIYGTVLVLGSAISFAVYTLWSKPQISLLGSRLFTSMAMLSASVAIFVHFVSAGDLLQRLTLPVPAYELILAIAILCTVVPSFLVAEAVNRLGPERTSIIGTSGPVMTSVIAVSWLGEAFTVYHFIGLTLVISAVWLMIKSDRKRAVA